LLKTIRAKLLVPILCAIVLGSLVIGFIGYRLASNIVTEAFEEDGMRSAAKLREYIDMVISKAQLDLSTLSVAPSVKHLLQGDEASEALVEGYIMALVDQHGIYNSITILDIDGIIVASTSGSTGGYRGDREYFQDNMKGLYHISGVELSRQTGRLATFISIPVRDTEDGSIIGAALTVIRLEELNARYVIPISLLGDHGYAMVVSGIGEIIAHRYEDRILSPGDESRAETDGMVSDEMRERLLAITESGGSAAFETVIDGARFRVFAERSRFTDWFGVVVCPVSEFNEAANLLARTTTILVIAVILFITLIIWVAVNGVTKALSTTIRYADTVAHGELDTSLSVKRTDEVGILANSLRDMVGELKNMITIAEQKTAEAEAASATIMAGINYASKIQGDLLPKNQAFDKAFADYSIIWKPRDIVGGDIFWLKNFDSGSILCVCDCTGHGAPGAMLTMLVVSAFEDIVNENNCRDTAGIIWQLEQRLVGGFGVEAAESGEAGADIHDGCDLAVLFIEKDGGITLSSANMPVFVCDGKEVRHIKGQRLYIGEGQLNNRGEIETRHIPANADNKYYVASDGLFDQPGGKGKSIPFGYGPFKQLILENHGESQDVISDKIWEAFEGYRGAEARVDDFELITFKP
jgi:serine phosphatase RsbU (regulator of sigma subunit)